MHIIAISFNWQGDNYSLYNSSNMLKTGPCQLETLLTLAFYSSVALVSNNILKECIRAKMKGIVTLAIDRDGVSLLPFFVKFLLNLLLCFLGVGEELGVFILARDYSHSPSPP